MIDYIGKYVKRFMSGSKGSLSIGSCGNDWGLSCGSYQMTLRYGNCINFLKHYFPTESRTLYFNKDKSDIQKSEYPGEEYCSTPSSVKNVWIRCYNKIGADRFFEYEHSYIQSLYYNEIKSKLKSVFDLDKADRAFKECFWSWSVHKGVNGSYDAFMDLLNKNNLSYGSEIEKEKLFDLIYDKRYSIDSFRRFEKGIEPTYSEREELRLLLSTGTIIIGDGTNIVEQPLSEYEPVIYDKIIPLDGEIVIIQKNIQGVNARKTPDFVSPVCKVYKCNEKATVVGITENKKFYKLDNNLFITTNENHVKFIEKNNSSSKTLYTVRIRNEKLPIYKGPNKTIYKEIGYVTKNQKFNIIEEHSGFGLLQSGCGWIELCGASKI